MDRRLVTAAFIAVALLPQALAAQQSSTTSTTQSKTTTSHNNNKNAHHNRNAHQSPWNRNVIVTGVNAQNYLSATATPKPPPKNKVNTGGEVFKKIGN